MTPFCSPPFVLIIAFSVLSVSIASPLVPQLLYLNCSKPSCQTVGHGQRIKPFLENLSVQVKSTRFVTFAHENFTGVMQCRLGLDQAKCSLCAQHAKHTILTLCPNSDAITAWFDGCYIQYNHNYFNFSDHANLERVNFTTRSCTNRTSVANPIQYGPALETLLLRLRAEVNLANHHGFSYGEIKYGPNSKFYGLVECVMSLSPKECELCIGETIERLNENCGDKEGGIAAQRLCLVRFGSHRFYSGGGGSSGGTAAVSVWQSEKGGGGGGVNWKQSLAWLLAGCSICILVIIFLAWLLKRAVLNRAQVAMELDEEIESKVIP